MTTTTSAAPVRDVPKAEFIALVAGLMALNALAIDVMLPALPYMGEALGVMNENDRHYVLTAYMLGFGIAQLAYGPLSDRFGRRGPLLSGIVLYCIAAFAAVLSPTFGILLALRFVQGMGAAATRVIATSIVRDKFGGRAMAEVMSMVFVVFTIVPIIAPSIGQLILLTGPWEYIFFFMAGLGLVIGLWVTLRMPETLAVENRRPLKLWVIAEGFRLVFTNRLAFSYGLSSMFIFGGIFGFISTSQQIFVDIYGMGVWFPLAFAGIGVLMAGSSLSNALAVRRMGMRRLSHGAILTLIVASFIWAVLGSFGPLHFVPFFALLAVVMFCFGWAMPNVGALSMEPLGAVAGTASAVFGVIQTVGGAMMGTIIGQFYNGTTVPTAAGFCLMGLLALTCVLVAEKGKLFGVGEQYRQ